MRRPNGLVGSNPTPSALTRRGFRAFGLGSRFLIRPGCWDDCWDVGRFAAQAHVLERGVVVDACGGRHIHGIALTPNGIRAVLAGTTEGTRPHRRWQSAPPNGMLLMVG
jgi:hypothetical protein